MAGYSAALPLRLDPDEGLALLTTLQQVAVQNVKMVLFTEPGERTWDINFGVGLKKYLFEQNVSFTRGQLRTRISNQINTYLPYINIINLEVLAIDADDNIVNDNSNFLKVNLLFSISGLGEIFFSTTTA